MSHYWLSFKKGERQCLHCNVEEQKDFGRWIGKDGLKHRCTFRESRNRCTPNTKEKEGSTK